MQLSKPFILFRHILSQFGCDELETLREEFNNKEAGVISTGHTYFTISNSEMVDSTKIIVDRLNILIIKSEI